MAHNYGPKTKNPRLASLCFRAEKVRRGHAEYFPNHSREFEPFALAVSETFEFLPDWHLTASSNPLVRQYQVALDAVLIAHSHLAPCAANCRHCGIRFLSHPRNVNRQDLLCPFGCREHIRRQASRERSRKCRQSVSAKRKKKLLNAKRSLRVAECAAEIDEQPDHSAVTLNSAAHAPLCLYSVVLNEEVMARSPLLPYLCMVLSLIMGRPVGREELLDSLRRTMRQHSIGRKRRIEYVVQVLNQRPP